MSRKGYPSDKQDQFMLRLPDGMRDRIKAAAEENNRSMNAEIVATLEEKYPSETLDDLTAKTIRSLEKLVEEYRVLPQSEYNSRVLDDIKSRLDMFENLRKGPARK